MDQDQNPPDEDSTLDSLEAPSTTVESADATETSSPAINESQDSGQSPSPQTEPTNTPVEPPKPPKENRLKKFLKKTNVYPLALILIVLLAVAITVFAYQRNKSNETSADLSTNSLEEGVLEQLRQTDVRVGDPQQILGIEANTVFGGTVLVRNGLEVAGQLKVGGPLSLPEVAVAGTGNFNRLQASEIQISGNATVQGQLTVQGGLALNGSLSVGGTLSAGNLNIENLQARDLTISRHIIAGGSTPGRTNGNALGSGGTSSISGTDTAGTININTGNSPSAGCFINVSFAQGYNGTPHVVVTPVGSSAGSLNFYINRSASGFSVCTANAAPGGRNFAFDYHVIN